MKAVEFYKTKIRLLLHKSQNIASTKMQLLRPSVFPGSSTNFQCSSSVKISCKNQATGKSETSTNLSWWMTL